MIQRPFFLTFEGIDGCGKSTQARRLKRYLVNQRLSVTHTFEPGGTALGRKLRTILVHDELNLSLFAEVLLFAADRRQDIDEIIAPALQHGDIVIAERFADSSIAYQGVAGQVGKKLVEQLMDIVTSGLTPDLTILLDIDPHVSLARKTNLDRIEQRGSFLDVVRHTYLDMAANQPRRWVVIDAARSASDVFSDVARTVLTRLEQGG